MMQQTDWWNNKKYVTWILEHGAVVGEDADGKKEIAFPPELQKIREEIADFSRDGGAFSELPKDVLETYINANNQMRSISDFFAHPYIDDDEVFNVWWHNHRTLNYNYRNISVEMDSGSKYTYTVDNVTEDEVQVITCQFPNRTIQDLIRLVKTAQPAWMRDGDSDYGGTMDVTFRVQANHTDVIHILKQLVILCGYHANP